MIEVILREDIRTLGRAGEMVRGPCVNIPGVGIAPMVRVPRSAPGVIPRYFDVGPRGLHVPAQGCA